MKKSRIKKFIIALLIVTIVCISVLALVIGTDKTYSTYVSVIVPEGDDVKVYVGGKDVKKSADGKNYEVNAGSTVTVTVVNEGKLFKSMTINGTSYASAVAEITVPDSGKVEISVETEEPYAEDVGKYFGNPYVLSKEADVLAVARILARGSTTPEDLAQIGADAKTTADDIRYGYYRLGTNLFINSSEFFGLGFRGGLPFGGCFDFDGYTATINLVRTSHVDSEFSFVGNTHYADYGFFAYAYGDGVRPCLIRNVKMQGFIGINTIENAETINHTDHVNVGGVAGTAGKNIVFDDVESTVSVSAQTKFADLYIGGIFGLCSSSVESWCPVRYNGTFNDVSGVTYGNNAGVIVGGFAGVLQNASVDGVTIDGERSIVLANALGNVSGSAIAGGFVGVVELGENANAEVSAPRPMSIKNVVVCAEHNYSVTAVIDNGGSANKGNINPDDFSGTSAAAVAGGIVGIVNRGNKAGSTLSDDKKIEFSNVAFVKSDISQIGEVGPSGEGRLEIKASTADGDSSGAVFAGGAVGYIYSHSAEYIVHNVLPAEETKYFFNCSVDVSATQNGVGPAYAGGAFGYNSFHIHNVADNLLKLGIVKPEYDYTVTAVQSATSTSYNNKYYNVCAGGYASRYNVGYSFDNAVFYIGSGRITAYREVGSTAIGDINAGGCVGRVFGYGSEATTIEDYDRNGSQSGTSNNVTVYYNENSRVEASCHSFSSINGTGTLGNNVCAGGAIGYVLGYSQISNLSLIFKSDSSSSGKAAEYFVSGSQNGKNAGGKDADLKTEGFVGGVFGLVIDSKLTSVSLTGDKTENSVVYFTSANSPNTASVGGLIGALWRKKITSNVTLLNGATVENVHAAGKAYCDVHGSDEYDLYVGGAIGVFANPSKAVVNIRDIKIKNCVIDAIGENTMLTYAGGIVAGMWWSGTTDLSYGIVENSAVTASSIAPYAYAGGIVGLMQNSNVSYCVVKDTDVKAISENSYAYAGGIAARSKATDTIKYAYSNASLNAQGSSATASVKYGIIAKTDSISNTGDSGAAKNLFVYETAGTANAYPKDSNTRALYLASGYQNTASVNVGGSVNVYSAVDASQSNIEIKSHNTTVATVGGLSVEGVKEGISYISVYCKVNNVKYMLCSYLVTVGGASESGSGISMKTDDGKDVNESNSDAYITYVSGSGTSATTYYYFRRHLGNPNTVGKVNVTPVGAEYLPQNVKFYDINTNVVGKATYFDENTTQADKEARIASIIAAKGAACNVSSFNGRANVGYNYEGGEEGAAKKSVYFQANDNVRENTVILMECDYGSATYGVIVEFVPNMLTGIEIAPESGTPPLDTRVDSSGVTHYIYTAGDVVRFGATLKYKYPAPRSYVVETIYSGTGVTENGTVVVSENGYYEVSCRDLKNTKSTKVIVEAKEEVDFSFAYSGATGSTDRKMLQSCHFTFSLQPQLGYGLTPTVSLTINGVTSIGQFTESGLSVSFGADNFLIPYTEDPDYEYSYNFVAGSDFVDYAVANGGSVAFSVTYAKIYSLVFISNYGVNEYFTTTVSAGEKFSLVNPDGFEGWTNKLINDRYGYDFKGFYTVSKAGDVSAYGKSFEDMQKDASSEVSGTMRFYARWTYNVTVESPEGVTVTSSMPRSMLEGGEIIPLDANNGFGFVIGTTSKWVGKPRYKSFIKLKDGSYTEITSAFSAASQENGYFVSSETLKGYDSGYIHIKVYADDVEFAVGDDPRYDGSALYTDGIYTVTYSVNYGSKDTVSDFAFNFALSLPKGTSMRLFYQKDGVSAWAGSLVLSAASGSVSLSEFGSMGDGSALTLAARNSAVSERFILVVTLPNNTNGFNINSATKCTIKVKNYAYKSIISDYGSIVRVEGDSPEDADGYVGKEYTLLPAVILNATFSSGKLSFTVTGTTDENVIDRRHSGVYYVWRIDKAGGGYIGDATFTSFGTEVVRTTDAIYYSATKGSSITISESLSGYRVSLLEARNIKQPSESYEIAILTGF